MASKADSWIKRDGKVISPSYTRGYPAVIVRGRGAHVWDVDGRRYLDFTAGIAVMNTGHSHPQVLSAIRRQIKDLVHMSGTDFYYPAQILLAEELARLFPSGKNAKTFFGNSGTEAIEAGMKLARYNKRRPRYLAFQGAFHGRTFGALSLTNSKPIQRNGFAPLLPEVHHAPYAYCYRCPLNLKYPSCGVACADYIEEEIFRYRIPAQEVAAIIVEPVQGEGGYVVPPAEWLGKIEKIAKRYGILLFTDEIQSGMGRTGKMFAVEHFNVKPDMMAIAKGIASGLPLGALVAKSELMTWPAGAHASTFGGNPVSCQAALTTIKLLQTEIIKNAQKQGEYLLQKLGGMQQEIEAIGDVRGLGLMIAIELVKDRVTKKRDSQLRDRVVAHCFKRGLLLLGCGPNSIRFAPPLTVKRREIDRALEIIREALSDKNRAKNK